MPASADVSYFNRAFRQLYDDTPSGVRAQASRHVRSASTNQRAGDPRPRAVPPSYSSAELPPLVVIPMRANVIVRQTKGSSSLLRRNPAGTIKSSALGAIELVSASPQ